MDRVLEKLIRTLERLLVLYEELLACSREKTDHLVGSNIEAIERAQSHEEMIITKIAQLSEVREQVMAETAVALGSKLRPVRVTGLILAIGEDQAEARTQLVALKEQLVNVTRDLGTVNRLNEQLCTQSLMHIEGYMGLVSGRGNTQQTYDNRGRAQGYHARALVQRSA